MSKRKVIHKGNIGNALHSIAPDHITTTANEIFDEERQEYQQDINEGIGRYIDNPEFIKVEVDNNNRIIKAIKADGTEYLGAGIEIHGNINTDGTVITILDNPEFSKVYLDNDGRILYGVQRDGNFYFGAGVPRQIIDYIETRIKDLSLDEYEAIVSFLDSLEFDEDFKTLRELLNEKVDKEEGKSLIDAEYASTKSTIDNPEFLDVTLDTEDKVLEGIREDGTKIISGDLNVGGFAKILGKMEVSGVSYKVIENPQYLAAWVDAEDKIIFGLNADGKTYVGDADFLNDIKNNQEAIEKIKITLAAVGDKVDSLDIDALSSIIATENPEYIEATTDSEGKLLAGRTPDGDAFEKVGFSTPKVSIDGHIIENIKDPEGRSEIATDSEDKIIRYRKDDGTLVENVGIETPNVTAENISAKKVNIEGGEAILEKATLNSLELTNEGMIEFQQVLKDAGFQPGGHRDWSDYISNKGKNPLHLSVPRLAYINLTNTSGNLSWPQSKTDDLEAIMEFNDMQGNYFKKNIIFNAQGNSSMAFIKKNGSIKMFDDSVYNSKGKKGKGDKFGVKFGDWVPQSTYHIKAYYTDFFKGTSYIAYQIALEVANTRGIFKDRTWKQGLFKDYIFTDNQFENPQINDMNLQIDNGALCQPDGFPCIIYLNGEFYGIYVWLIKKDAANFNMEDKAEHIHLDGRLDNDSIFNANGNAANMNWNPASDNGFEVRNPKDLICMFPYTKEGEYCWEYDADVSANQELAGIRTISEAIPQYDSETSYAKSVIVSADNRIYLSKVENNIGHNPTEAKATDHSKALDKATNYWIDVTFTNQVKTYILTLSTYDNKVNSEITLEAKKALFETLFDVSNLIDYEVVQAAVHDTDGFSKNWQWTTWDGVKWFVNNYDKDCSFGNDFTGIYTVDAPSKMTTWYRGYSWMIGFLVDNYNSELKARWTELVNKGIFTKEYIINIFKEWIQRIGSVNYNKEYTKWPEAPCNRDSGINTKYWRVKELNYVISPTTTYDETASYEINDECIIAVSNYEVTFICINPCTGQNPITKTYSSNPTKLGYRDNLWRVSKYIEKNLQTINMFVNS